MRVCRQRAEVDDGELSEVWCNRSAGADRIMAVPAVRPDLRNSPRPGDRVAVVTTSKRPAVDPGTTPAGAAAFLEAQEITTTECRRCGTQISGINGRYACGGCGWVSHWSESHTELPTAPRDDAA